MLSKEPDVYKPACAMGVFPALGAHLVDVHFPYADHTMHEATFMTNCMAPMSSGKSCVNRVCEPIMADIKACDDENRKREDEWKEECRSMGANKQKPKRSDDLIIQIMSSDLTNAALVQKLQDAHGHFLYTQLDEVELFDQLKDAFTHEDAQAIRIRERKKKSNPTQMLCTWIDRGYITRDEDGVYHKTPTYLKRMKVA